MDKEALLQFLLKARTKTYAGAGGKVKAVFKDSKQLEYKEGDFSYRDVYYNGNGVFAGVEVVYLKNESVFSMSYFGNYKGMGEDENDKVLRKALMENWDKTRIWEKVEWQDGEYNYTCDGNGDWDELGGTEEIYKTGERIYWFYYAGGLLKKSLDTLSRS